MIADQKPVGKPVLALSFVVLLYFVRLLSEIPGLGTFWDEGGHLSNGVFFGSGIATLLKTVSVKQAVTHLKVLSAQYNTFIALHYPPIFYLLEGVSFAIFGPAEMAGKLVSMLFSAGTLTATYKLGETLFGRPAGLVSAVFLAASPLFFRSSTMAMMDTASAFFFVLSVYAFVRFLNGKTSHIVLGAVLGLALLTRFEPMLLFAVFPIHLAITRRLQKYARKMGIAFLIALLMAAPWYFISFGRANPDTGTEFSWFLNSVFNRYLGGGAGFDPFYFAGMLLPSLSLIIGLLGALGLVYILLKSKNTDGIVLILWISVVYLFFSITPVRMPRHSISYLPAFALLAGNFATVVSKRLRLDWKPLGMLVVAALVFDVATYETNINYMDKEFANYQYRIPTIEQAADYLAENAEGGRVFQLAFRHELGPAVIPFYIMTKHPDSKIKYRDIMSFQMPPEGNLTMFRELLKQSCPNFIVGLDNKQMNENARMLQNLTSKYQEFVKDSKSYVLDKRFEHEVFDILIYRRAEPDCRGI